jgi:mRNA-degrading endonuclease RelE of RelBE toxin-antitoxin system
MVYSIVATEDFDRQLKHLAKKYFSIPSDYAKFLAELLANPTMGDDLGNNTKYGHLSARYLRQRRTGNYI